MNIYSSERLDALRASDFLLTSEETEERMMKGYDQQKQNVEENSERAEQPETGSMGLLSCYQNKGIKESVRQKEEELR